MRVLVTGAAGLTGSNVTTTLLREGHHVVGVVRRAAQRSLIPADAEAAVADCDDPAAMDPMVGAAEAVVHVAGITAWRGLAGCDALDKPGGLVVVSSAGVYSRHRASAAAYRRGEDELRARRPDAVIVRPTMIYGSARDRNVHNVIVLAQRFGILPLIGTGSGRIQPIHYMDLAAAVTALMGRPGPLVLDAGGGSALSLRAAGEAIFTALGRPPRFMHLPAIAALTAARALDAVTRSRWEERIERMSEDRTVDNGPLIAATGFVPRPFAEGVRNEVAEMFAAA